MNVKKLFKLMISKLEPLETQARKAGVVMGTNNYISSRFWSSEPYLITIGSNCQITTGVYLHTHGGGQVLRDMYPNFDVFGKVSIGDYCYLGNNCMVMPGVTLGDHVLVAAGSIVTKSVPSGMVVAGNPARIICTIEDYRKKNEIYNVSTKGLTFEDKKKILLSLDDCKFIKK